jgi:3-dehydroquinate synthase
MGGIAIAVNAPGGAYDIIIEASDGLDVLRHEGFAERPGVIVTNTTLEPLYGPALRAALPRAPIVTIPDGEAYKTLDTAAGLYRDFVAAGLDRGGVVFAFGGGVVGDVAGFAAATYMRGVDFVQIPTTLLAMVDSSVGGKVGVDLPQGKNLVGAFKQPEMVLIDTRTLDTLPDREWRCGLAEVIKHGLLEGRHLLGMIEGSGGAKTDLVNLIHSAVLVKVFIVEEDPYEAGVRAHLNLGHTFGHAVEQVSGYALAHGEAVAVGLVAAARLSYALGYCDAALVARVERIIAAVGLPSSAPGLDPDAVYAMMATDKKWRSGRSRFVLLRGVGAPFIAEDVPKAAVMEILNGVLK